MVMVSVCFLLKQVIELLCNFVYAGEGILFSKCETVLAVTYRQTYALTSLSHLTMITRIISRDVTCINRNHYVYLIINAAVCMKSYKGLQLQCRYIK